MSVILSKLQESRKELFVGLAGPGTGKSHSFKEIIESDEFKGKRILILTFINKLVEDLTNDFENYPNVEVSTLHKFAIKNFGQVNLEEELDRIISEDRQYITGDTIDYNEKIFDNKLVGIDEDFYKKRKEYYQHGDKRLYSLNSVIHAANRFFAQNQEKIPSGYDLILVDEFQDFNKCEFEFLRILNLKNKLIVVGDDHQSLYTFKRAQPDILVELFKATHTEEFTLDYCHRCPRVIVDSVNDLITNAKSRGLLTGSIDKKFIYFESEKKNKISDKYKLIDFVPGLVREQLIYWLSKDIRGTIKNEGTKRVLVMVPSYLKREIYEGLTRKGFNVVDYEPFSDLAHNEIKHKEIIKSYATLVKRKTDNLALRKVLQIYYDKENIRRIIRKGHKNNTGIWSALSTTIKKLIEIDIDTYKKARSGKDLLNKKELNRISVIFSLKEIISKLLTGFSPTKRGAIEIDLTTVISAKGLSAELVYYIGVDNNNTLDPKTKTYNDFKICEFLVALTRTKEKLTLISSRDKKPAILELINSCRINNVTP